MQRLSAIGHSEMGIAGCGVQRVVHERNLRVGKLPQPVPRRRQQIRQLGCCRHGDGVIRPCSINAAIVRIVESKREKHPGIQRVPDVNDVGVGELK